MSMCEMFYCCWDRTVRILAFPRIWWIGERETAEEKCKKKNKERKSFKNISPKIIFLLHQLFASTSPGRFFFYSIGEDFSIFTSSGRIFFPTFPKGSLSTSPSKLYNFTKKKKKFGNSLTIETFGVRNNFSRAVTITKYSKLNATTNWIKSNIVL